MRALRSIVTAFCMFSRIPMPQIEWKDDNMRFMLAAFPMVGLSIGLILMLFYACASAIQLPRLLWGAGLLLIPLLITGGIHLDGFADVTDALSSHAPMEKKRQILKDPHSGAFAVISVSAVMILNFAMLASLDMSFSAALNMLLVSVLSRACSGICAIIYPGAGEKGLLSAFRESADKKICLFILFAWVVLSAAVSVWVNGAWVLFMPLVCALAAFHLYRVSQREFGGMSGDLSGYYLVISESAMTALILAIGGI